MKKILKVIYTILLTSIIVITPIDLVFNSSSEIVVEAHSGRTDSNGGHKDNKNKSGLGSYHYHCNGNPAHLHTNGVCPYDSTTTTTSSTTSSNLGKSSVTSKKDTIKAVQKALNDLGYDCGKADGIYGKKTKSALKKFQEDNDLKVDGVIGKQVLKA